VAGSVQDRGRQLGAQEDFHKVRQSLNPGLNEKINKQTKCLLNNTSKTVVTPANRVTINPAGQPQENKEKQSCIQK
jgi:hypothetical protein